MRTPFYGDEAVRAPFCNARQVELAAALPRPQALHFPMDSLPGVWQTAAGMSAHEKRIREAGVASAKRLAACEQVPISNFHSAAIGNPAIEGSTTLHADGLSLTGGGIDVWGVRDEFRFCYTESTGDFSLCARMESLTDANLYTKAGIMARESLEDDCRHVFFQVFPNNNPRNHNNGGCEFQYRAEAGAEMKAIYPARCDGAPEFPVNYPNTWIALKRSGNGFAGAYSSDGRTWKSYSQFSIELPRKLYLGLAVTSHDIGKNATAVFRDIAVSTFK